MQYKHQISAFPFSFVCGDVKACRKGETEHNDSTLAVFGLVEIVDEKTTPPREGLKQCHSNVAVNIDRLHAE